MDGAWCCKYGTPMVLPEERERIIKKTGKDCFERKEDYFIIPKNPCPFLTKNNLCSIHEVKPIDCKAYPIGAIKKDKNIGKTKKRFS